MGRDLVTVDGRAAAEAAARIGKRLDKIAAELGRKYTAVFALPTEESRKLTWFDGGTSRQPARPVFTINRAARDEVIARVRERFAEAMLRGEEPSMLPVLTVGANALRAVFARRLETSGGDTPFRALSPAYAAWKRRAGLDSRIGVARGLMLAALKRAQVVVRKA